MCIILNSEIVVIHLVSFVMVVPASVVYEEAHHVMMMYLKFFF